MSVIEKNYELEAYFQDAGKPRDKWRVGTEYEKVGIYRDTGQAIPYFGKRGVDFILRELIGRFGWDAEEQDGEHHWPPRKKSHTEPIRTFPIAAGSSTFQPRPMSWS